MYTLRLELWMLAGPAITVRQKLAPAGCVTTMGALHLSKRFQEAWVSKKFAPHFLLPTVFFLFLCIYLIYIYIYTIHILCVGVRVDDARRQWIWVCFMVSSWSVHRGYRCQRKANMVIWQVWLNNYGNCGCRLSTIVILHFFQTCEAR